MNAFFFCRGVSLACTLAVLGLSLSLPVSAQSSPSGYEFRRTVKTLVVNGAPTSTPTDPAPPTEPTPNPVPALSLSTQAIDFGNVATNTTEKRQVLVSNPGTGTLSITSAPSATGAAFAAGLTTCGATLAAGADCLLEPTFSPTATGTFNGVLSFTTALAGSPHEITLVGTAFNPISLASAVLPRAKVNRAYTPYDFSTLLAVSNEASPDKSKVTWETQGTLPPGMTFDPATALLSGTPTSQTSDIGQSFTVLATYKNNQGQQVYSLVVNGAYFEAVQISLGDRHACAVTPEGGAKCWGLNGGRLGDGTTTQRLTPVDVAGLTSGVSGVFAGYGHSCAVLVGGALKCWGVNSKGQLGDGTTTTRLSPVAVSGLSSGVASASLSRGSEWAHTCAVTVAGAAKCWGANGYGQLGDGTTSNRTTPVDVVGLSSGVRQIAAGTTPATTNYNVHTCAVLVSGGVKCWGEGANGRLGTGDALDTLTPVDVVGLTDAVQVSLGRQHTCAVTSSGMAKCWGYNNYGQLGDGTLLTRTTPVTALASGASRISVGEEHTCAVTTGGGAFCWGYNGHGRLGDGTTTNRSSPVAVSGLSSAVDMASGEAFNCATTSAGVKCWGNNTNGQLGDGTTTIRYTPVTTLE